MDYCKTASSDVYPKPIAYTNAKPFFFFNTEYSFFPTSLKNLKAKAFYFCVL